MSMSGDMRKIKCTAEMHRAWKQYVMTISEDM